MKKTIIYTITAIAISAFFTGCGPKAAGTEAVTGNTDLKLDYIRAYLRNGTAEPAKDAQCKVKFAKYLGKNVFTDYSIDSNSYILSAVSTFDKKQFNLSALGEAGKYSFAKYRPPQFTKAFAVYFNIGMAFQSPSSEIMFFNGSFNCLLTSNKKPNAKSVSAKFKVKEESK